MAARAASSVSSLRINSASVAVKVSRPQLSTAFTTPACT